MKIECFTIKNYRSIKELKIDKLTPVNVFFGKNNVGKSNILRGLHLAFYCLRNDDMFLPDTMFHNRNIYRPIQITVDLILEEDFFNVEKVVSNLAEQIQNMSTVVADEKEMFVDIGRVAQEFIGQSEFFRPLKELRLETNLDYNDEKSDIGFSLQDSRSDYAFDFGKYKILYEELSSLIRRKVDDTIGSLTQSVLSDLEPYGAEAEETGEYLRMARQEISRLPHKRALEYTNEYLTRYVRGIKEPRIRQAVLDIIRRYKQRIEEQSDIPLLKPFLEAFTIVKEYFERISDNFILIPNKEYFPKGPLLERKKNGHQIEIFDLGRFEDRLLSLIESPSKKERTLIQRFNKIFSSSYGDLGELEIRKFREKVFAIFDTGFSALPIEDQGLGVQDLFLYLSSIILFDSSIIAIEEPESGLSTENQRILHETIRRICSRSDKQVFISSHSEEFETANSYIIETGKDGTKEISKIQKEKEYEEKIDQVLIKRRVQEERERYEALLREVTERQMTLDILEYVRELGDEEKIDAQKISDALGYEKKKVQEILKEITRRK